MNEPISKSAAIDAAVQRSGFSREAVETAWDALKRSGGTSAQFSNPELGGSGQWMGGSMLQIGDMFNHALKARVATLLTALSQAITSGSTGAAATEPADEAKPSQSSNWWPEELGSPGTAGGQNDLRYAYFPESRRLLVEESGKRTLYNTLGHHITGVAQQQGSGSSRLAFTSDTGAVPIESLPIVP